MKRREVLVLFLLSIFLVSTVMAASSDIVIWTNPDEKAIATMFNEYGEKITPGPLAIAYDTGLNTLTVESNLDEVTLKFFVKDKDSSNFLRNTEYQITLGENYELDYKGDTIKIINRAEPESVSAPVAAAEEETGPEVNDSTTNITVSENNSIDDNNTNLSILSDFSMTELSNGYVYGTALAVILAGAAAFVVVKSKKKKKGDPKIGGKKKTKGSRVVEKLKRKVTKEDVELKEIQGKIQEKRRMIEELKKEKERKEKLKSAKKRLEEEEKELRKLLHEKKKD